LPIQIKRRGNEASILIKGKDHIASSPDQTLISLVAKARAYLAALTDGSGTASDGSPTLTPGGAAGGMASAAPRARLLIAKQERQPQPASTNTITC
jgi:X-X-X-Leu-X-X-Gly heptad repeat protein